VLGRKVEADEPYIFQGFPVRGQDFSDNREKCGTLIVMKFFNDLLIFNPSMWRWPVWMK
jgi:hypothetical protein